MIGNDIHIVNIFADLGVRYMTLSHFYNDEWSDSSTDKPAHNGLTDYRQRSRPRNEPAGNHGRYFARVRQNFLRRAGGQQGAADRLALFLPRHLRSRARHDAMT